MEDNKNIIPYIFGIIIYFIIIIGCYVYIDISNKTADKSNDYYEIPTSKTQSNTYNLIDKSDKDMVSIYFHDFINKAIYDLNNSYELVEGNYRKEKFPTLGSYRNYINSITKNLTKIPEIASYKIVSGDKYNYYMIYDKNNRLYVFEIDAVMKYNIYFDNDIDFK